MNNGSFYIWGSSFSVLCCIRTIVDEYPLHPYSLQTLGLLQASSPWIFQIHILTFRFIFHTDAPDTQIKHVEFWMHEWRVSGDVRGEKDSDPKWWLSHHHLMLEKGQASYNLWIGWKKIPLFQYELRPPLNRYKSSLH